MEGLLHSEEMIRQVFESVFFFRFNNSLSLNLSQQVVPHVIILWNIHSYGSHFLDFRMLTATVQFCLKSVFVPLLVSRVVCSKHICSLPPWATPRIIVNAALVASQWQPCAWIPPLHSRNNQEHEAWRSTGPHVSLLKSLSWPDRESNPPYQLWWWGRWPGQRLPDRRVLGKFPWSQHRPSLITPPRFSAHGHSDPVNCGNFHKVDWKHFCFLRLRDCHLGHMKHREDIQRILQDPAIRGKNYVPRWDKEFDTLYCSFIRAQVATGSGRAASPLSLWLEQKKQQFWQILAF